MRNQAMHWDLPARRFRPRIEFAGNRWRGKSKESIRPKSSNQPHQRFCVFAQLAFSWIQPF
jgi:hypothetical protein